MDDHSYSWIETETITVDEEPTLADQASIKRLAVSIEQTGVINPLTINNDNKIVAGRKRLAACKLLGWQQVPCRVVHYTADEAAIATIDENLFRRNYKALELSKLLDQRRTLVADGEPEKPKKKRGRPAKQDGSQEVAALLGIRQRAVKELAEAGHNIEPTVAESLKDADLTKSEVVTLAKLSPKKQEAVAALVTEGMTPKDALEEAAGGHKNEVTIEDRMKIWNSAITRATGGLRRALTDALNDLSGLQGAALIDDNKRVILKSQLTAVVSTLNHLQAQDVCSRCSGKGCRTCRDTGFLNRFDAERLAAQEKQ